MPALKPAAVVTAETALKPDAVATAATTLKPDAVETAPEPIAEIIYSRVWKRASSCYAFDASLANRSGETLLRLGVQPLKRSGETLEQHEPEEPRVKPKRVKGKHAAPDPTPQPTGQPTTHEPVEPVLHISDSD